MNITALNGHLKELMSTIEDFTADGWWDWHIQDDYEYMSPRFWKILGYDKEEEDIPDHPSSWQNKIHQDDLKLVLEDFDKHVKTKGKHPFFREVRYKHKNGDFVWVICRGKVIEWGDDGTPLRMVGVHIDINKLKKTEEQLNEKICDLEARDKTLNSLKELLSIANKVSKR